MEENIMIHQLRLQDSSYNLCCATLQVNFFFPQVSFTLLFLQFWPESSLETWVCALELPALALHLGRRPTTPA